MRYARHTREATAPGQSREGEGLVDSRTWDAPADGPHDPGREETGSSPDLGRPGMSGLPGFDNSYAALPAHFHVRMPPTPVSAPRLELLNEGLCEELGIDPEALSAGQWAQVLSGNQLLPGSEPLAMAYAGHQFGHFVPQLGDGRAILLGELIDRGGQRRDIQLKGSGRTPFSRGGDGRAALAPMLREYLVSEAMHALGVPSTRALAVVSTGERVLRDVPIPGLQPGAILTRVARSHVRVGSFQYFAARGDVEALKILADHVLERHTPDLLDAREPYWMLLARILEQQAQLVARWMSIGFVHGVMNTDNMSISGETLDYGPCAFIDAYRPGAVFSAIDRGGRYAYARQPEMAQWNLARLAETLLPLLAHEPQEAVERASEMIQGFPDRIGHHWLAFMRAKLGLRMEEPGDAELIHELLEIMARESVDFTLFFRRLSDLPERAAALTEIQSLLKMPAALDAWLSDWQSRLGREPEEPAARSQRMRGINPAFIPRNHLLEKALAAATQDGDLSQVRALLDVLTHPFDERPQWASYMQPPPPGEEVHHTFCGT